MVHIPQYPELYMDNCNAGLWKGTKKGIRIKI